MTPPARSQVIAAHTQVHSLQTNWWVRSVMLDLRLKGHALASREESPQEKGEVSHLKLTRTRQQAGSLMLKIATD